MNLQERLEATWQQGKDVTTAELTVLLMIQEEKIRVLSRTASLLAKEELRALDMALGQFLISKEGGEW